MKTNRNQKGSILLAVLIAICILAVLYLQGYIKETRKAAEEKHNIKQSVDRAQESINQSLSNMEESLKDQTDGTINQNLSGIEDTLTEQQDKLKEKVGE